MTPPTKNKGVASPPETACPPRNRWEEFLEVTLPTAEQAVLENHFDLCPDCRTLVASLAACERFAGLPRSSGQPLVHRTAGLLLPFAQQNSPFPPKVKQTSADPEAPELPGLRDLEEVGRGGNGVVYRGVQTSLKRTVAVKILGQESLPRDRHRIEGEAQALARLKHPHIVTIFESGMVAQSNYLVMEWIAGGTLQDRIDVGHLDVRDMAHWMLQLAEALAAVHSLGIIHRDLKPANVLLDPSAGDSRPIAKLTDFGFARAPDHDSRPSISGSIVGTPAFMAPEQTGLVPALGVPGPACDLYGLGAVAYAGLTGRPPHEGVTTLDTLVRVAWEEPAWIPKLRPDVPTDLAAIIARCLRTHPSERYRNAGELAADLEQFLAGRPVSARPASPGEQALKWVRRNPSKATSLGLLSMLILFGLGGIWYHLWVQQQAFETLALEKHRVDVAIEKAGMSLMAERQSQLETLDVLQMATQTTVMLINTLPEVTDAQWQSIEPVRQRLRAQIQRLSATDPKTGEVVVRWLTALSSLALNRFSRSTEAMEDLEVAIAAAQEFPDSAEFRNLEAQALIMRWEFSRRLNRPADEAQTVAQIFQLCDRQKSQPERAIGIEKVLYLATSLWERNYPHEALTLISATLPLQRNHLGQNPEDQVGWGNFRTLLVLQAKIQHQLGEETLLAETLRIWDEMLPEQMARSGLSDDFIHYVALELLPLRIILADHGGQTRESARWMEEAQELMASDRPATAENQLPLLRRLRFLNTLRKENLRSIDQEALTQQLSKAIDDAQKLLQVATPIPQWQELAADFPELRPPIPQTTVAIPSWTIRPATTQTPVKTSDAIKKEGE